MNWKFCLAILTCNVVFMSSSYTMLIPFLPMYLTRELGVDAASVNIWSGVVFFVDLPHQRHHGAYLGTHGRPAGQAAHGHPRQPALID